MEERPAAGPHRVGPPWADKEEKTSQHVPEREEVRR